MNLSLDFVLEDVKDALDINFLWISSSSPL